DVGHDGHRAPLDVLVDYDGALAGPFELKDDRSDIEVCANRLADTEDLIRKILLHQLQKAAQALAVQICQAMGHRPLMHKTGDILACPTSADEHCNGPRQRCCRRRPRWRNASTRWVRRAGTNIAQAISYGDMQDGALPRRFD